MIDGQQCRSARAALAWSRRELASLASLNVSTIYEFENNIKVTHAHSIKRIQEVFEATGIVFTSNPRGIMFPDYGHDTPRSRR